MFLNSLLESLSNIFVFLFAALILFLVAFLALLNFPAMIIILVYVY